MKWTPQQYKDEICKKKQAAMEEGLEYIDLNSKQLLDEFEPGVRNLPAACRGLSAAMLEGDKYLERPTGFANVGAKLTVRYFMKSLTENRREMLDILKEKKLAESAVKYADELFD